MMNLQFPKLLHLPLIAFLLLTPAFLGAETNAKARVPSPLGQFLDTVNNLPIEYRADLQLNALERQKPVARKPYQFLLKSLFGDLSSATRPYPAAYAGKSGDTLERTLASASSYAKLDALSLEMRAIRIAFPIEPRWSSTQLMQLRLSLPRVDCSEALVPDVNSYYTTVGDLLFPASTKVSLPEALWFRDHIRGLQSPLLLPAIAQLLARSDFSRDDFEILLNQLETTMAPMSASDRELGWMASHHSLSEAIEKLAQRARNDGLHDDALIASYRQFLINSLAQKRCIDSITDWNAIQSQFNKLIEDTHTSGQVHPLTSLELVQQPISEQHAREHPMPVAKESDQILGSMYRLRMQKSAPVQSAFSAENKDDLWQRYADQISSFLAGLDISNAACTECLNFFKEKVLLSAFDLIPDDQPQKQEILQEIITGLANDPTQSTEPALWADHLKIVLNLARPVGGAQAKLEKLRSAGAFIPFAPSSLHVQIRDKLMHSTNDVLAAYELADQFFGNTFTAPYLK